MGILHVDLSSDTEESLTECLFRAKHNKVVDVHVNDNRRGAGYRFHVHRRPALHFNEAVFPQNAPELGSPEIACLGMPIKSFLQSHRWLSPIFESPVMLLWPPLFWHRHICDTTYRKVCLHVCVFAVRLAQD